MFFFLPYSIYNLEPPSYKPTATQHRHHKPFSTMNSFPASTSLAATARSTGIRIPRSTWTKEPEFKHHLAREDDLYGHPYEYQSKPKTPSGDEMPKATQTSQPAASIIMPTQTTPSSQLMPGPPQTKATAMCQSTTTPQTASTSQSTTTPQTASMVRKTTGLSHRPRQSRLCPPSPSLSRRRVLDWVIINEDGSESRLISEGESEHGGSGGT